MEIKEKIAAQIASVLRIDIEQVKNISEDENLNRIGIDSINFIEIIISLEDEYNIAFEDEELLLENLNTVNKLYKIISDKVEITSN